MEQTSGEGTSEDAAPSRSPLSVAAVPRGDTTEDAGSPNRSLQHFRVASSSQPGTPSRPDDTSDRFQVRGSGKLESVSPSTAPGVLFHEFHRLCREVFGSGRLPDSLHASISFYLTQSQCQRLLGGRSAKNATYQLNQLVIKFTEHWAAHYLREGILFRQNPDGHGLVYFIRLQSVKIGGVVEESNDTKVFVKVGCTTRTLEDRAQELRSNFNLAHMSSAFVLSVSWKLVFTCERYLHDQFGKIERVVAAVKVDGRVSKEVFYFSPSNLVAMKACTNTLPVEGHADYEDFDVVKLSLDGLLNACNK